MKYVQEFIIIILIGLVALTGYMALLGFSNSVICVLGSDCVLVQNSDYGKIFGVSVSLFGVVAFGVLLILTFFGLKRGSRSYNLFSIFTLIGAVFAAYFLFLQFFVIRKLCFNCIIIDFLMLVIFVLNGIHWMKHSRW